MRLPSQCDRVLAVLADGRSHDIAEIHERAGTMRLNSRVAELRKRGHEIVCERVDGTYSYQLRSLREPVPEPGDTFRTKASPSTRLDALVVSGAEERPPAPSETGSRSEDGAHTTICEAPSSLDPSGADGVGHSAVTSSAPGFPREEEALVGSLATRAPDAPEQLTLDVAA